MSCIIRIDPSKRLFFFFSFFLSFLPFLFLCWLFRPLSSCLYSLLPPDIHSLPGDRRKGRKKEEKKLIIFKYFIIINIHQISHDPGDIGLWRNGWRRLVNGQRFTMTTTWLKSFSTSHHSFSSRHVAATTKRRPFPPSSDCNPSFSFFSFIWTSVNKEGEVIIKRRGRAASYFLRSTST